MNKLLILQVLLLSLFSISEISSSQVSLTYNTPLEKRTDKKISSDVTIIEESENVASKLLDGPLAVFYLESVIFPKSNADSRVLLTSVNFYDSRLQRPCLPRSPPIV
ncbi:MAG: hypothetical protein EP326_10685 [Deltaproteobacteria bacterium]|nr:MAG: hypothetical protein EP326_10685 [Deltaproteobacteria bacterium]